MQVDRVNHADDSGVDGRVRAADGGHSRKAFGREQDPFAHAQGTGPVESNESATRGATREEVEQLRSEVAAQRRVIDELKSTVQQLLQATQQAAASWETKRGSGKRSPSPWRAPWRRFKRQLKGSQETSF